MRGLFAALVLISILHAAYADTIIANSASWQDIYSSGIFAAIKGYDHKFLVSLRHGEALKDELKKQHTIVVESDRIPFVKSYATRLEVEGIDTETIRIPHDSANLDLARRIQTKNYYIVDSALGYDAISAAPLAIYEKAYVLFATKDNIQEVDNFLQSAAPEKITLLGEMDSEVTDTLLKYNPEIIRKGSRYKNNIELAERFRKETGSQQALLTNGEFLVEDVFIASQTNQPILYIGRNRPPAETMNYLKSAGFKTTVLIGNDLVSSAKKVKDLLQIPMFVKFGKGMTQEGGIFKKIQGLDTFPVPRIDLLLYFEGIGYNTETGNVELYIKNEKPLRTYLLPSIAIKSDGQLIQVLGDEEVQLMNAREQRGFAYAADIGQSIGTTLTAEIVVPYGYTPDEMDEAIETEVPLTLISEPDDCELEIKDALYNKETQGFEITVTTNKNCFAQAFIKELKIDNEVITPQSDITEVYRTGTIRVKQPLTEIDIADNPEITVEVRYGSRAILTKTAQKTFKFRTTDAQDIFALLKTPLGITMAAIIILLLILLIWRRKK